MIGLLPQLPIYMEKCANYPEITMNTLFHFKLDVRVCPCNTVISLCNLYIRPLATSTMSHVVK